MNSNRHVEPRLGGASRAGLWSRRAGCLRLLLSAWLLPLWWALATSVAQAQAQAQATAPEVIRFGVPSVGVGSPPRLGAGWLAFTQQQRRIEQALADENGGRGIRVEWVFF